MGTIYVSAELEGYIQSQHTVSLSRSLEVPGWGKDNCRLSKIFKDGDALSSSVESEIHLKEHDLDIDNDKFEQAALRIKPTYPQTIHIGFRMVPWSSAFPRLYFRGDVQPGADL